MTTELRPRRVRVLALLVGIPVALLAWGLVLVVMALFQPPGRPVAVIAAGGPQAALAAIAAAGGSILEMQAVAVIAIADNPDFVRRLYAGGPLLVVGARGAKGCAFGTAFTDLPPRSI